MPDGFPTTPALPAPRSVPVAVNMGGVTVSNEADEDRLVSKIATVVVEAIAEGEEAALATVGTVGQPGAE